MHVDLEGLDVVRQAFDEDVGRHAEALVGVLVGDGEQGLRIGRQRQDQVVVFSQCGSNGGLLLGDAVGFDDLTAQPELAVRSLHAARRRVDERPVAERVRRDQGEAEALAIVPVVSWLLAAGGEQQRGDQQCAQEDPRSPLVHIEFLLQQKCLVARWFDL